MTVSYYYDNMPRNSRITACHSCEYNVYELGDILSKELIDKIHSAISAAIIKNDDSDEVKKLLGYIGKEDCETCHGKGFTYFDELSGYINFNNRNAGVILSMMGYRDDQLYSHSVSISEFKRRLMYAKNINASKFEIPSRIEYGKPKVIDDNVIDLKPVRIMDFGLSAEEILERLKLLEDFVKLAESNSATQIYWG